MTMLYRSPDIQIDGVVWHVTVDKSSRSGRRIVHFRFRKSERDMWSPIHKWHGRLPKGLRGFFSRYQRSIKDALVSPVVAA